jgi:hypothetical protein
MVPVDEMAKYDRDAPPDDKEFVQLLRGYRDKYPSAVETPYRHLHIRHLRNEQYFNGNHFIEIDPETFEILDVSPAREFTMVNNQFAYFVTAAVSKMLLTPRKFEVVVEDAKDRQAKEWAENAQQVADWEASKISLEDLFQEKLRIRLRGRSWRYIYSTTEDGPVVDIPTTETENVKAAPDTFQCADCLTGGELGDDTPTEGVVFPPMEGEPSGQVRACPNCGSANIDVVEGEVVPVTIQTGTEKINAPHTQTEFVDDLEMRWYVFSKNPRNSPWLERRRLVLVDILEQKFPGVRFGGSDNGINENDSALRYQTILTGTAGQFDPDPFVNSMQTATGDQDNLRAEFREVWIKPSIYAKKKLSVECVVGKSKMTIPAGVELGEIFPGGIYTSWNGERLLDVRNEDKDKVWFSFVRMPKPAGGFASGDEGLIPLQDRLNYHAGYRAVHLACRASGTVFINPNRITSEVMRQRIGNPGTYVTVDNLPPGADIKEAAFQMSGETVPGEIFQEEEMVLGHMQAIAQAYATHSNAESMKALQTATGSRIMSDEISQISEPVAALHTDTEAQWLAAVLELNQATWVYPRWVTGGSKGQMGKMLGAEDIQGRLTVKPMKDSHLARGSMQIKQDMIAAVQMGAFTDPEEQREAVVSAFGVDQVVESAYRTWERLAFKRLQFLKEACAAMEPFLEEAIGALGPAADAPIVVPPPAAGGGGSDGTSSPGGSPPARGESSAATEEGDPSAEQMPIVTSLREQLTQSAIQQILAGDPAQPSTRLLPDPRDVDVVFAKIYQTYWAGAEGQADSPLCQQALLVLWQMHVEAAMLKGPMMQMLGMGPAGPGGPPQGGESGPPQDDNGGKSKKGSDRKKEN